MFLFKDCSYTHFYIFFFTYIFFYSGLFLGIFAFVYEVKPLDGQKITSLALCSQLKPMIVWPYTFRKGQKQGRTRGQSQHLGVVTSISSPLWHHKRTIPRTGCFITNYMQRRCSIDTRVTFKKWWCSECSALWDLFLRHSNEAGFSHFFIPHFLQTYILWQR